MLTAVRSLGCRVLFVSLHRYDNGYFYPGKPGANHTYVGGAGARGFNVNVAWNNGWMGDSEYLAAFHQVVLPVAYEVETNSRWPCTAL